MSFGSGFISGTLIGNAIGNSSSNIKGNASKLFSMLNYELQVDEKIREERIIEKEENKNKRYSKLNQMLTENHIKDEFKNYYLSIASTIDIQGFYVYDVNDLYMSYDRIQREYQSQYYRYQGEYRCVAWVGDILSKDRANDLKCKKEELLLEKEKLKNQLKDNIRLYHTLKYDGFYNVDFNKYSDHIQDTILKLLVPELESYIMDKSKETIDDIMTCINNIDKCIFKIDSILAANQENVEKTISYKIKKIFKKYF